MHFLTTRIKSFKNYFLTSGVVKNVFWCISRTPESSEWWKTCFDAFTDHQNQVLNKLFFNVWSSSKRVFCICAYLQTTRIKSLKNYFFTSGVVKNVFWCISWSPESKNFKNYFLASGVVKNVFWCISRTPESSPEKIIFSPLEWLKTCFDAFPDHQNQVLQKLFFNVWSG